MIFGFNTDVKHGDNVYHVQTEAHPGSHSFRTTVFQRGQCLGKKTTSYADLAGTEVTDEQLHQMLKEQHRHTVDAIREGHLEDILKTPGGPAPSSDFL
jgi:hypothetical protein